MNATWQLPEIPDTADGFSITRVLEPVGWTGQLYENTGADGGVSSVRKVLVTAYRLKTLTESSLQVVQGVRHVPIQIGTHDAEGYRTHAVPADVCLGCSDPSAGRWVPVSQCASALAVLEAPSPTPYATVTLVDDAGNDLDGLTFSIPTHQAFLWWAAQMPLTPIADDWLGDVVATFPEDPRVELLLTPDTARLVGSLLATALISGAPATADGCMTTLQVIDVLRRLTGYADRDSGRQLEPEEDPTSPLAFLLDHYTGQHLRSDPA